jgi:hypothetical protein
MLRDVAKTDMRAEALKTVEAARQALTRSTPIDRPIAEAALLIAEASQEALSARIQSDEARVLDLPKPEARLFANQAKRAEAELAAREAELRLVKAQLTLASARKASKAGDEATRKALTAAEAGLAAPGAAVSLSFAATRATETDYTPLASPDSTSARS